MKTLEVLKLEDLKTVNGGTDVYCIGPGGCIPYPWPWPFPFPGPGPTFPDEPILF